jgi:small subunit ribosomal protein S3
MTHVLTKMGLMGIQLKIASKAAVPQEFEVRDGSQSASASQEAPSQEAAMAAPAETQAQGGKQDGQA